MATLEPSSTTLDAIRSLSVRLRRIEYLLSGTCEDPVGELEALDMSGRDNAVMPRLAALDHELAEMIVRLPAMGELLKLYAAFPEIFKPASVSLSAATDTLTPPEKAAVVLVSAPEFHAANSQLSAVMDTPLPDTGELVGLVEMVPRIRKAELVQEEQRRRVEKLRERSVRLLERWYEIGVEGVNDCFVEWDERTWEVERELARRRKKKEKEEEDV